MTRIASSTLAAALMLMALGPTAAVACDEAERLRLADEISNLASKNAWSGVERKYNELLSTKCDLKFEQYSLGAESAKNLGKTYEMYTRLEKALAIDPAEELQATFDQLQTNYGRVEIRGDARRRAALLRDPMPFAPDQRKSIEYAQSVMEGTGSFKGMLPVGGPYKVADKEFEVKADQDWQVLIVGKGTGPKSDRPKSEGLNWIGPVAFVGTGFFGSPAPSDPIFDFEADQGSRLYADPIVDSECEINGTAYPEALGNDERGDFCFPTIRQPDDIGLFSTPSIDVTIGGEIGITYRAPEAGVMGTVGYRRMFGNRLNQITVWGAGFIRPGRYRFAVGPTWGVVTGKGNGYVPWVEEGQTRTFREQAQGNAEFRGFAMGAGIAASAGMSVFDVGPFEGAVELHGNYMRDNRRPYSVIGIRVGIVPKIDRFEG